MTSVNLQDVQSAYSRIEKYLSDTGVVSSERLDNAMDAEIYLKPEHLQRTGSFKFRGAMSAMTLLSKEQLKMELLLFHLETMPKGCMCSKILNRQLS